MFVAVLSHPAEAAAISGKLRGRRSAGKEHHRCQEYGSCDPSSYPQRFTASAREVFVPSRWQHTIPRDATGRETARMRWEGPCDVGRRRIETPPRWTESSKQMAGYGWPSIEYQEHHDRTV